MGRKIAQSAQQLPCVQRKHPCLLGVLLHPLYPVFACPLCLAIARLARNAVELLEWNVGRDLPKVVPRVRRGVQRRVVLRLRSAGCAKARSELVRAAREAAERAAHVRCDEVGMA